MRPAYKNDLRMICKEICSTFKNGFPDNFHKLVWRQFKQKSTWFARIDLQTIYKEAEN